MGRTLVLVVVWLLLWYSSAWGWGIANFGGDVPRNLLLYWSAFDSWGQFSTTTTADTTAGPDGTTTADTVQMNATTGGLEQIYSSVVAGRTYTFSFYAKRGTATDLKNSVYDYTNTAEILAPTSYYSSTNASTFTEISYTFVAPAGCTEIGVYPLRDSGATGTVYLWGGSLIKRN